MKPKKTKDYQNVKNCNEHLEKSSRVIVHLGLVLALFVCYVIIEHRTKKIKIELTHAVKFEDSFDELAPEPFQKQLAMAVEVKSLAKKRLVIHEAFVKASKEEEIIAEEKSDFKLIELGTLPSEDFNIDGISVIDIPEEIEHDVPIKFVEKAPVYPGCEGTEEMLKACLAKKITRHINKNFNAGLGQELGLVSGRKQIYLMFTIDKTGGVSKIKVRGPHPQLEKEAERLAKLLPKMTPGIQGTQPVGVSYVVPIAFHVE